MSFVIFHSSFFKKYFNYSTLIVSQWQMHSNSYNKRFVVLSASFSLALSPQTIALYFFRIYVLHNCIIINSSFKTNMYTTTLTAKLERHYYIFTITWIKLNAFMLDADIASQHCSHAVVAKEARLLTDYSFWNFVLILSNLLIKFALEIPFLSMNLLL